MSHRVSTLSVSTGRACETAASREHTPDNRGGLFKCVFSADLSFSYRLRGRHRRGKAASTSVALRTGSTLLDERTSFFWERHLPTNRTLIRHWRPVKIRRYFSDELHALVSVAVEGGKCIR